MRLSRQILVTLILKQMMEEHFTSQLASLFWIQTEHMEVTLLGCLLAEVFYQY